MGGGSVMRLVVGYLATPGGADALALGIRLARTLGAELDVCIMLSDRALPAMVPTGENDDLLGSQAEKWLADAMASVPTDVSVHSHIVYTDSTADGLITEAARLAADAIVVGGSGGGLAGSYSLGSVVNQLLHSAPMPVAVAPRGMRDSPVQRVREVSCAIGRREGTDLLLEHAVRFSSAAGTPLRLISLVALDPTFDVLRGDVDAVRHQARDHAAQTLEAARRALPANIPVTSTIVDGRGVEDAVGKLDWHDGDLIMVGSSRLSAPRRLFLGSTAAKMLRVLHVPMVVIPREQFTPEDLP
ncbi:universal stress protein UspA [Mycolicibacterium doricum]|uniref:Universal stress protein UspA n=2 Tax=Mycolicibacterium doricum TaxID=126673 RepID=A0A7I7VT08_9MYCO|nr:universal stress protein UspA [Mycolicibacterium doricum]